jgi:NADH:ubiquinone oxidoreductase subunit F (NADH-binding)
MVKNILSEIKKASLVGRGGANFPVCAKWEAVKKAKSEVKYLLVNGAEGEPGVHKDDYILKNYREDLFLGIKAASDFIKAEKIYIYLNHNFLDKYKTSLNREAKKLGIKDKIVFVLKPIKSGYIAGEETTILNIIEGKDAEPRIKPPFPTTCGLFGKPTLIHNIETLYDISLVSQGRYEHKRMYSVNVGNRNKGVYSLPTEFNIERVLIETDNYPSYDFFVQVGGDADGEVLNMNQLQSYVSGAGSITIHNLKDHDPEKLIGGWLKFFKDNSCGNCNPCREGTYRLYEMFKEQGLGMIKDERFKNLCDNLYLSSFCALGSASVIAIISYLTNVYSPSCSTCSACNSCNKYA